MTDPVTSALAEGLKPADTISTRDLVLIGIGASLNRIEKLQEQTAKAASGQADALEIIAALFGSVIGVSNTWCPGQPDETPSVNYLRSGDGAPFRCDQDSEDDED